MGRRSKKSKNEFYDYIMGLSYPVDKKSKVIIEDNLEYRVIDKTSCKLIGYKTKSKIKFNLIIPKNVKNMQVISIGESAFSSLDNLKSVTLPEGLVEICPKAFCWCRNLENINFPSTLKSIGYWAFECCDKLFSTSKNIFEMPISLEIIGNSAFSDCFSIEKIIVGKNIKYIGDGCFSGDHRLKYVNFEKNNLIKLGRGVFYNCLSLKTTSSTYDMSVI